VPYLTKHHSLKFPLCDHVPKLFTFPLACEFIFFVFPTAASMYKLFVQVFVIILQVDISEKELAGLDPGLGASPAAAPSATATAAN
jgi:hypothetical protein